MLNVTVAEREAFGNRPTAIDRSLVSRLHYLGNYLREIPSNLTRMMENAYDWEHLPFVHPTSFAEIELVEQGPWGWRCKTALPHGGGEQLIELLVDKPAHYWATTVVQGPGEGTQIHTQAAAREAGGITVDVRFYAPQPPVSPEQGGMILAYLQAQYKTLYDEDEALMLGRQAALDERKAGHASSAGELDFGMEADLDRDRVHHGDMAGRPVVVRFVEDRWIAHAGRCPHALGPLGTATPDADGHIACPWHGYRFDLETGREERSRCGAMPIYRCEIAAAGRLLVSGAAV